MFWITREQLIVNLTNARMAVCCYNNPEMCDCKYGANNIGTYESEETGCPELGTLIGILSAMTDQEYREYAQRANAILVDL